MISAGQAELRRRLRAVRRRLSGTDAVWQRALPSELSYWTRYIETGGAGAPQELQGRLDPAAPILDPYLVAAIDRCPHRPVRILDVGAGPITSIGYRHPREQAPIEIVAVDPLGDAYGELLRRAGITPPVATQQCRGEDVAGRFGAEVFDIAYARNALDHAADPMAAITAMLHTVRPGGTLVLVHGRREGEARGYEELHQWNFDLRDGRFVLFGRGAFHDVGRELDGVEELTTDSFSAGEFGDWVVAIARKRPRPPD